jgi:cytidylate kinase
MGRGSQYILQDHPDAVHILLVDSLDNRIANTMVVHKLSEKKAAQLVRGEDKRRAALYKKIGKSDYENAHLYDMVVNLGRVQADTARNMILELVRQKDAG